MVTFQGPLPLRRGSQRQKRDVTLTADNTTAEQIREFSFTFTPEQFQKLHSNLVRYPVANAVMASASFP